MLPTLLKLFFFASFLLVFSVTLYNMWKGRAASASLALLTAHFHQSDAQCGPGSNGVDLRWHAPNETVINNLTAVINGTGIHGFQFMAVTPSTVPYRTYNWCNMPHVRQQEYIAPPPEYKLEYVEVVGHPPAGDVVADWLRFNAIIKEHRTQTTPFRRRHTHGIAMMNLCSSTGFPSQTPNQRK